MSEWLEISEGRIVEVRIGVVHTVVPGWAGDTQVPNTCSGSQEHKPFRKPFVFPAKMPWRGEALGRWWKDP